MKFMWFSCFLLALTTVLLVFIPANEAAKTTIQVKRTCKQLERDGYCEVELFCRFMQAKCPRTCESCHDNCDKDSGNGGQTPVGGHEPTYLGMGNNSPKESNSWSFWGFWGMDQDQYRMNNMENDSPKGRNFRGPGGMRIMRHHRGTSKHHSESPHLRKPRRHRKSKDKLYCNDFKAQGFCNIKVFECFMRKHCNRSCGFLPAKPNSTFTEPILVTTNPKPIANATEAITVKPKPVTTKPKTVPATAEQPTTEAQPASTKPKTVAATAEQPTTEAQPASTKPKTVATTAEQPTTKPKITITVSQMVASTPSAANVVFTQAMVSAHNELRALHSAPNMESDRNLTLAAQRWADHLAATNTFQHDSNRNGAGENLAWSSGNMNAVQAVTMWYNEIKDYNFNNPGFTARTGHFTQVVWKASTLLGGAFAKTATGATYIVARYKPPGNVEGQFSANVLPVQNSG